MALFAVAALWNGSSAAVAEDQRLGNLSAPNFENFGVKDGLSDEIFSTVGMDSQGFIWAGSASGLFRFDGYRWQGHELSGVSSLVRDMLTDSEGQLWAIFEREGLVVNRDGHWQLTGDQSFFHRFNSNPDAMGEPSHWLAQANRIFRLESGQWRENSDWLPPGDERIVSVAVTHDFPAGPTLWVARTLGQLWSRPLDDPQAPWVAVSIADLPGAAFTDLVVSRSEGLEELWVLTYGSGIVRLRSDGSQKQWRRADGALPSEAIYSGVVTYDETGRRSLWVSSRGGLLRFSGEELSVFDRSDGLPSNAIRGIKRLSTPSGQDVLWLATEQGVTRVLLAPSPWRTVSRLGASENGIFGVFADQDASGGDRIVVGSGMAGLAVFSGGEWTHFNRSNGRLPSDQVRGVWPIGRPGELGLVSMDNGRLFLLTEDLSLVDIEVQWPLDRSHGVIDVVEAFGEIWIGTLDAGIWRLDERSLERVHDPLPDAGQLQSLDVQSAPSGGDWVWGATTRGLLRINEQRYERVELANGSSEVSYRDVEVVQEGSEQVLWASTLRHGVVRYSITDPEMPTRLVDTERPPVPDPTIYSVRSDSQGRIYICTNNGVQQLIRRPDGGFSERVFRRRDGLAHDECNSRSQFIDSLDRFWVGTLAGLSVHDPVTLENPPEQNRRPSPLRLTHIELDERPQSAAAIDRIDIPASTQTFAVHAALLTQQREVHSEYRFTLASADGSTTSPRSDWSQQPFRVWSTQAPGDYRLRIEARDFAGIPARPLELTVHIEASWFERPLTRITLAVATAMILFGVAALYTRQLRQRRDRLQMLVDKRTTDLAKANRQLVQLSFRDPLTGAANRRRLDLAGRDELKRAAEKGQPLSLILLDLDHFKRFNDRHGHLAGDQALKFVAQAVAGTLRTGDLIARFGGEEFACLLPDTSAADAAAIAERARSVVMDQSSHALADRFEPVTISVGVATSRPNETSLEDLIDRADQALYQAKDGGRNQVISINGKDSAPAC
jgi:diguanylate cyclase (GGDEF)-like protein